MATEEIHKWEQIRSLRTWKVRLVTVLAVDNQELTAVNIFTNKKNDTTSFLHVQIHSPIYTAIKKKLHIHTHKHISWEGKPDSKLKMYISILIQGIMQTMENSVQLIPEGTTFKEE